MKKSIKVGYAVKNGITGEVRYCATYAEAHKMVKQLLKATPDPWYVVTFTY